MQRREEDHTISRQIKYTEGKFRKLGTTLVTQQQTNGRTLEITYKIPLEKVLIEENPENYHQIKGACPLPNDPWLYRGIGAFRECPQVEAIIHHTYFFPYKTDQAVKTFLRHIQRLNTVSNKKPQTL